MTTPRKQSKDLTVFLLGGAFQTGTKVRVEVHLSNGTELGPTEPSDLEAGTSQSVFLSAKDEEFDTWGAHPEVGESGGGEHGTEENHD